MPPKVKKSAGISHLIRSAGHKARAIAEERSDQGDVTEITVDGRQTRIFNVLNYVESPWGLNMTLYPVQRFIVKLYYNLPLDDKLPEETNRRIRISDMFNTKTLYTFTEKEYLQYLYNEGRCNIGEQDHMRRQLTLPIGRRAGKCCLHGTICATSEGFREIQDLGDPNGPEYQPLKVGVAQEGSKRSTSAYFYNGGVRDTIRVRSRCGYEIEGTPNHRIRVMAEDGTIQWRFLGDMRVGDRIGIHRKTDLWASAPFETSAYHPPFSGREIELPEVINERWATLLGVLVGDGSWNYPSTLEVTVGPYQEWLTQVEELFRSTLGRVRVIKESHRDVFRVRCYSLRARQFFSGIGYTLNVASDAKRIPWVIWRSPKSVVAAFLRGLFETDGGVERGGRIVSFSTASQKLASELQLLLLNFGIVSRVKPRFNKRYSKTYYHLTVLGAESVRLFSSEIGFLSERKNALLRAHITKGDLGNKSPTESIPFQRVWCRRLLESVPKNTGDHARGKALGWRRSLLRAALGNVIKSTTEDLSYPRLRAALAVAREVGASQEAVAHFETLLGAGYFYDEVTEITPSRGRVYDLTVPDGESFVANGMTNHNTTLSAIFASYELYRLLSLGNPQDYYGLPNGNRIQIISVATDKDQAGLLFNDVTSHMAKCEFFKPYIANNTLSYVQLRTPYDIERYGPTVRHESGKFASFNGKASIRVTFKASISKGLRGSGNVVIILDEIAHFQEKGTSSAKDIYDAITPSAAAFSPKDPNDSTRPVGPVESRIICISSPLNKSGKFYELYHLGMSRAAGSENMLVIQAPTWEVNPTIESSYYREKYHEDPAVFMTEHGALFSDRVRGWIEREQDLVDCIRTDLRPKSYGPPRFPHQIGVDVGMVGDGTTVAITHCEGPNIVLDYHEAWYAGVPWKKTNPHLTAPLVEYAKTLESVDRLDFDEIANWIFELSKRFYLTSGLFDRWNGLPLEQALHKKGLKQFRSEFFTRDDRSRMFQAMKLMLFDRRVVLYDWPLPKEGEAQSKHSPLIEEILSLQAQQMARNQILVEAPKIAGAHDDISDALVRAVWQSLERISTQKITAPLGDFHPQSRGISLPHYQLMRARKHGIHRDRLVPRSLRRR